MAPGESFSLWGTGLAHQFFWPRPPQTCSAGFHVPGFPRRAAQSCAPQPWRTSPEQIGRLLTMPPSPEAHCPRVLLEAACVMFSPAPSASFSQCSIFTKCPFPHLVSSGASVVVLLSLPSVTLSSGCLGHRTWYILPIPTHCWLVCCLRFAMPYHSL